MNLSIFDRRVGFAIPLDGQRINIPAVSLVDANGDPVSIGSGGSSGGLTDAQLRASAVPVSIGAMPTTPVTGTFWQATQPVSGSVGVTGSVAVTGPLTDTQLRATAVPISGTVTASISGTVPVSGTFWQATQPVSIASMPSTPVTGTFWQATQPVSIAATVAVSGPVTDAQMRASPVPVSGTVSVSNASLAVTGAFFQATQPVSIAGTVNVAQAALTKGAQGTTGLSTQDLKDAGRVSFAAATVIGGVTAATTEALLSVVPVRDGVAAAAATSIPVTSGKRLRLQVVLGGIRSSAATVLSGRIAVRMNPTGAVTATSPIIAILSMTQQAAALAEAGDTQTVPIPDGFEISGTQQIGFSQVCSGVGGVVYLSVIGFEY